MYYKILCLLVLALTACGDAAEPPADTRTPQEIADDKNWDNEGDCHVCSRNPTCACYWYVVNGDQVKCQATTVDPRGIEVCR